jgi:hypothetical protein
MPKDCKYTAHKQNGSRILNIQFLSSLRLLSKQIWVSADYLAIKETNSKALNQGKD